ncbi:zinc-dependent alcohol dehydrogenase [Nocardia xishanensis]
MRALCWNGVDDLTVETVDEPTLITPRDAIVRVRLTTTCGSDLRVIDGSLPGMREGDVLGHEFMGEVVEIGREVGAHAVGERVVVPSFIGCGGCWYCANDLHSLCDTTNPCPELQQPVLGFPTAGRYGSSHPLSGYQGSHAQYVRVPFADVNCFAVPEEVSDEQALFLSDAVPTGFMGADFCDISPGDTVAVWGSGGVGLMAGHSARLLGAERVVIIDRLPERLAMARKEFDAETIDCTAVESVPEALREATGGRGPDACIDAVGMGGHGTGLHRIYDRAKQLLHGETDRATALREAILACRKGGVVAVLGVYDLLDKFPMGAVTTKNVTIRTAQQYGQRYVPMLFDYVRRGELDPAYLITHDMPLEDSVSGYDLFENRREGCVRVVFRP